MYDVLASNEAKELDVGEVGPALQLPGRSVYLAPSGTFFCQHKTRLVPITKAVRFQGRAREVPLLARAPAPRGQVAPRTMHRSEGLRGPKYFPRFWEACLIVTK